MASGRELPIGGAGIAPLNPGEVKGTAAPGEQGGEGTSPEETPKGSVAQPDLGKSGDQVAQPDDGDGAAGSQPAARPGKSAEERIQQLTTEVNDLRGKLKGLDDLDDLRDLADELDEAISTIRGLSIVQSDSPTPPGGAQSGVKPTEVPKGVESQILQLSNKLDQLSALVQKGGGDASGDRAFQRFSALESDLITKAGIKGEEEVAVVKELITTAMDKDNLDWTRPRVARRVIRGAIDKYISLRDRWAGQTVKPGAAPTKPTEEPPVPKDAVRHRLAPEDKDVDPLDQAHRELGPIMEQIWGKKGGGVV